MSESTVADWQLIINPASGNSKQKKKAIVSALNQMRIPFQEQATTEPGQAFHLVQDCIRRGQHKILACGGDGTVHEVINGILTQTLKPATDISLAYIPCGSANDWARTLGISEDPLQAVKAIKTGNYFRHDIGRVQGPEGTEPFYFANVLGTGFDALVAHKANAQRKPGRRIQYRWHILKNLNGFSTPEISLIIDDQEVYTGPGFSVAVGIGKYNGNGMTPCPDAVPDDGYFDVTVFTNPSKWDVLTKSGRLYSGDFFDLDFVRFFRGQSIRIESIQPVLVEADGESRGELPVQIDVLHRHLKCLTQLKNKDL
ncbi:MAG: diacylglycerol kinase family lipid kinase [Bacteroidetes bacterium]|nr:diacylglycerol kinase family lipid kinase [Bacteroidota bacterium]